MFYLTTENLGFFLPLGFIGLYRWLWFILKILAYKFYKPLKPRNNPKYKSNRDVTVLIPTIDSGDEILVSLQSILKADPFEIIFITITSNKELLEKLIEKIEYKNRSKVRVITVKKPNKRTQMIAGCNSVKTPIIVFCDDDVLWPSTMLDYLLAPFEDKQVGGVGTSQNVMPIGEHWTVWEVLAAYRISMRNIEVTASTYIDGGVCCLSGRTAAYRSSILRDPEFQKQFTNEYWLGKYHQHSGDDKFLTRWLHSHDWKSFIQCCTEAELSSSFKNNWRFLKQLVRWTRNTWRSDMRSVFQERYIWKKHPYVAWSMLDKFFNPITLLAGPVTIVYYCTKPTLTLKVWVILVSYLVWLLATRFLKYMPHFLRRPVDVLYLPVWILFSFYFAFMKIYCLFTLHVTDWGTRASADNSESSEDEIDPDIFIVKEEIRDFAEKKSKQKSASSNCRPRINYIDTLQQTTEMQKVSGTDSIKPLLEVVSPSTQGQTSLHSSVSSPISPKVSIKYSIASHRDSIKSLRSVLPSSIEPKDIEQPSILQPATKPLFEGSDNASKNLPPPKPSSRNSNSKRSPSVDIQTSPSSINLNKSISYDIQPSNTSRPFNTNRSTSIDIQSPNNSRPYNTNRSTFIDMKSSSRPYISNRSTFVDIKPNNRSFQKNHSRSSALEMQQSLSNSKPLVRPSFCTTLLADHTPKTNGTSTMVVLPLGVSNLSVKQVTKNEEIRMGLLGFPSMVEYKKK